MPSKKSSPIKKNPSQPSMLSRFDGDPGRELLLHVLSEMPLLQGINSLEELIATCSLEEIEKDKEVIRQGGTDNDLFLIISGSFAIEVNGRWQSKRLAGTHVGESALIDPTVTRSATARACETSIVLRCPEAVVSKFARKNPILWRRLAVEMSRRLAERNESISSPRTVPVLFIGSSSEALPVASEVQNAFAKDRFVAELWTDGIFNPSKTAIEDLVSTSRNVDFAALVLTADDVTISRKTRKFSPRDNVIFELGLMMGSLGRDRVFLISPSSVNIKVPSDLAGVNQLQYQQTVDSDKLPARVAPVCHAIRRVVAKLGAI